MISALKQDRYERNVKGKLPEAHGAFLDEVFKASSSILNSLLRIMNERRYENDGYTITCPLVTMFGASNEMPPDECAALWDRFHQRLVIEHVSQSKFRSLLYMVASGRQSTGTTRLTLGELGAAQAQADALPVNSKVLDAMAKLRQDLDKLAIRPSPRRWCDGIAIMRAHAWLRGAVEVGTTHLPALKSVLWIQPDDRAKIQPLVDALAGSVLDDAKKLSEAAARAMTEWRALEPATRVAKVGEYMPRLKKLGTQLAKLEKQADAGERVTIGAMLAAARTAHAEMIKALEGGEGAE